MSKKIAVLIPTFNRSAIVTSAIKALLNNKESFTYDIYVVDNGSTDNTKLALTRIKGIHVLHNQHNNFVSKALNQLFIHYKIEKKYKYCIVMAHDVLMRDGSITQMVRSLMDDPKLGLTAPVYYEFETGTLRTCGLSIGHWTSLLKNHLYASLDGIDHFVSCFALRSALYKKLNGLDGVLFPMIYEEPDFGERVLELGLQLRPTLSAKIWHPIQPGKKPGYKKKETQLVDERMFGNPAKAYLFFRNRIIFMSKYVGTFQFVIFFFIINPLISVYYLQMMNSSLRKYALIGILDGTRFAISKSRRLIEKRNRIMLNI